ncbi:MAG TPA: hypothetical protein VN723_11765 [Rhizomicrobium sp.]|jgi:hypothetical protein|nr:hypothetical protein [Rhizomicrobium sp.]
MAKKKLLEDIKARPGRFYRLPGDVVRDRRFDDGERLEILEAWAEEADAARTAEIRAVIADLERRRAPKNHAAE